MVIGDPNFPINIGDFFTYSYSDDIAIPGGPGGVPTAGTTFTITVAAGSRLLVINFNGTVGGEPILEGRDYTVNWLVEFPAGVPNPNVWRITLLTTWDGGTFPTVDLRFVNFVDSSLYDTLLGDTPTHIGGTNPAYIRNGALDPNSPTYTIEWAATRTENIDRPLQLTIDDNGSSYTDP